MPETDALSAPLPLPPLSVTVKVALLGALGLPNLARFCLSGCFSRPQQIVFATKATDAKFWPRQRPPLMGFPGKAYVSGVPGTQGPIPVRRNPQAQRKGWQHELSLTATSCGLLKQPDKQESS